MLKIKKRCKNCHFNFGRLVAAGKLISLLRKNVPNAFNMKTMFHEKLFASIVSN